MKITYNCLFNLLFVLFLIYFVPVQLANAQSKKFETNLAWLNIGIGTAFGSGMAGPGLIANAQYDSPIGLAGIRYFRADDNSVRVGFPVYVEDISELSITYGTSYNFGRLNFSASAGAGMLWGTENSPGNRENYNVITFPVQGSIIFRPVPIIGMGVMLSSGINSRSTIHGALFVLQLGRLM